MLSTKNVFNSARIVGYAALTALTLSACGGGGGGTAGALPPAATSQPTANPNGGASDVQGISGGIGYGSPALNDGKGTYFRNAVDSYSDACSTAPAADATVLNLVAAGNFADGAFSRSTTVDALWSTEKFSALQSVSKRRPFLSTRSTEAETLLPSPDDWVKVDVRTGYYLVVNGGARVGSQRQCFAFVTSSNGLPYDAKTGINADTVGGYQDPRNVAGANALSGKVTSIELHGVKGAAGAGTFVLDNGWRGIIVLDHLASLEVGRYRNGIDLTL